MKNVVREMLDHLGLLLAPVVSAIIVTRPVINQSKLCVFYDNECDALSEEKSLVEMDIYWV